MPRNLVSRKVLTHHKLSDLRDRTILGLMAYSFARVSALTKMQVKDFYQQSSKSWFILHEKGGKLNKVPAHHKAAGIKDARNTPLFRSLSRRGNAITDRAIDRKNVFHMIHRKIRKTGLPKEIGCHSLEAPASPTSCNMVEILKRRPGLQDMPQPVPHSFMPGVTILLIRERLSGLDSRRGWKLSTQAETM
ncbi:hypothetical protein [Nitrosomonas sp.]|uniref:hypothetical protein n=1 Tax=Nitrosomonas sp. TaxID=42353 RepID=UPI0026003065|nr:hypothetical protein [Nitrosomonas sp.]